MQLTKDNAQEIAKRMSETLSNAVLFVGTGIGIKVEYRHDENGLDKTGWSGESAKQELPVKVLDTQLLWSTGHYSYSLNFDINDVVFPNDNTVAIVQNTRSGDKIFWSFINYSESENSN